MMHDVTTKPVSETPASPPKGRPTAERVSAINQAILNAATECFLSCCSYEGASMDAIATAARVSKATLYARFQKETLFQVVVQDLLTTWWTDVFRENWRPAETFEQCLREHVRMLMVLGSSKRLRAFDRLLSTAPPRLAHTLRKVRHNQIIDVIARDISEFASDDGEPIKDPRRVATDLVALLAGWFRMESMIGEVTEQEAIAFGNRAVDLLLAARKVW
jgi:AcrR family transcriptional regulator